MGLPSAGAIVVVPFPFSDLSQTKLRPAVVLVQAGRRGFVLCQVTSNPYADLNAVQIAAEDLLAGSLRVTSYARPGKLFTASWDVITDEIGTLRRPAFDRVLRAVLGLLETSLES